MGAHQTFAIVLFAIALCYGQEQTYCGRSLARAIAVLCYDAASDGLDKKSGGSLYSLFYPTILPDPILRPSYKDQNQPLGWLWTSHKARANSLTARGKRLVVNECCDKPCSLHELMSYCDV